MEQAEGPYSVDTPDSELDTALRANELQLRALHAERARILAAVSARGTHHAGGHRSIAAYLRATCNTSTATSKRDHTLAGLVAAHPGVADALEAGVVSVDHALQIARIHRNPRISHLLASVLDALLDTAEHLSVGEFDIHVGTIIGLADQDGAYREQSRNITNRRAWIDDMAGTLHLTASGGDPLTAAQTVAVFETFADAELRADLETRRAEWGDQADGRPLPRTQSQRNHDALVAVFAAAAGSPEAAELPEPTVDVVIDHATLHDTLTHAGLTLPNGSQIALDDHGRIADPEQLLDDLTAEPVEGTDALSKRICNLTSGAAVHPSVVLRALLTGHVRRVVVESRNVVTDMGARSRLFTGAASEAALLLSRFCTHPGCSVRGRHSQVDHMLEWVDGGTTDQANAQARCGPHNRFKHRTKRRSRRDERGRTYDITPEGVIVLPVGERSPDLTTDQMNERARARLRALVSP